MKINVAFLSLFISIIAIILSLKSFLLANKMRTNDVRPFFEDTNDTIGVSNKGERIPIVNVRLKNSGGKAIILNIKEKTEKRIYSTLVNASVENSGILDFNIKSNKAIAFEDFNYKVNIFFKDIDSKTYIQKIQGENIFITNSSLRRCMKFGRFFLHF